MTELNRLRWRARRGMLELDILLLEFLEQRYPALPPPLQNAFAELLNLDDGELWRRIQATQPGEDALQAKIIERLQKRETKNEGPD